LSRKSKKDREAKMARRRLHMRKAKQILRLTLKDALPHRAIARSLRVGRQTVADYLQRAKVAGISSWDDVRDLTEAELQRMLFSSRNSRRAEDRRLPSWQYIHKELKAHKGSTLFLLWKEYYEEDPSSAYSYSQFCLPHRKWRQELPLELRWQYSGGEVMFVDYSGKKIPYIDRQTGEVLEAEVFVVCLGASNYIYAEAQASQKATNWIQGHINAFEHLGGVVQKVVPDNLKAGVRKPCYYEPQINTLYDDLRLHYDFVVMPTRVASPTDKGKVECGVQQVQRWVIAPLRKRQFFSLEEINEAMRPLLEELNTRKMKHIGRSRKELFEEIDRPALKELPRYAFEVSERKAQKVGQSYHVSWKGHYYSVPYELVGKTVEIRATGRTVEVYHEAERVASHIRDDSPGGYSTVEAHMPEAHRAVKKEESLKGLLRQARRIGPPVMELIEKLYQRRRHPEQAVRAARGILDLRRKHKEHEIEAAC